MRLRRRTVSALTPVIESLPLFKVEDDAWESFLQSEKENRLSEPFYVFDFSEEEQQLAQVTSALRQLADILEVQSISEKDDSYFWEILANSRRCASDSSELGLPEAVDYGTITQAQAFLLLVVQCLHSRDADAFLAASRVFLCLCQCRKSVENFFGPNLFIGRKILSPLRCLCNPEDTGRPESHQDEPMSPESKADGDGQSLSAHTSSAPPPLSEQQLVALGETLRSFLKRVSILFLQLDLGRDLVAMAADTSVCCLLATAQENPLRELLHSGIVEFVQRVHRLRTRWMESFAQDDGGKHVAALPPKGSCFDDASRERVGGSRVGRGGQPLILVNYGHTAVDVLIFTVGCFIRPLVVAFVCRPSTGSIMAQAPVVPKRFLVARQRAVRLVRDLMRHVPTLLKPDELAVCLRKGAGSNPASETVVVDDDDDDEADGAAGKPAELLHARSFHVGGPRRSKQELDELVELSANDPFCAFLARACILVPDRRDPRDLLAAGVVELLSPAAHEPASQKCSTGSIDGGLLGALRLRFCQFLQKLMDCGRLSSLRAVGVDVAAALLEDALRNGQEAGDNALVGVCKDDIVEAYLGLLFRIVHRTRDIQPGMRARALECLASLISTATATPDSARRVIQLCQSSSPPGPQGGVKVSRLYAALLSGVCPALVAPGNPGATLDLGAIIRDRACDARQLVRKSALAVLRSVATFLIHAAAASPAPEHHELQLQLYQHGVTDPATFRSLCADPSLQVRVKAIATLHDMLEVAPLELRSVRRLWLSFVPPAVQDPEKTVMEKALDCIHAVFIDGLMKEGPSPQTNARLAAEPGRHTASSTVVKQDPATFTAPVSLPWLILDSATAEDLDYIGRGVHMIWKRENGVISIPFLQSLERALRTGLEQLSVLLTKNPGAAAAGSRVPIYALCHIIKDVVSLEQATGLSKSDKTGFPFALLCEAWTRFMAFLRRPAAGFDGSGSGCEQKNGVELTFAAGCVLEAMRHKLGVVRVDPVKRSELFARFHDVVTAFKAPLPLVSPVLACMKALEDQNRDSGEPGELAALPDWVGPLVTRIQDVLTHYKSYVMGRKPLEQLSVRGGVYDQSRGSGVRVVAEATPTDAEAAVCLLTLGDLVMLYNRLLGPLPSGAKVALERGSDARCPQFPPHLLTTVHALATDGVMAYGSDCHRPFEMEDLSITPQRPSLSQGDHGAVGPRRAFIPDVVRAQGITCLGKLCLMKESLTKKLIDVIAVQLSGNQPDAVRCNTLTVFADFCIRYAFLADRYLPQFTLHLGSGRASHAANAPAGSSAPTKTPGQHATASFQPSSPLIRKQTLCLIAGLVAQDFIKCKGLVVFRLLSCLGDPVPSIRRLAESVITHILMPRQANFIQIHVVEMICFMCSWPGHPVLKAATLGAAASIKKGSPFCFLSHPRRRQTVYAFFLQHMTDKDRHELSRRLVHDFLGAFVDTTDEGMAQRPRRQLELPRGAEEPAGAALRDALRLLGCKQMKITFHRQRSAAARGNQDDDLEGSSEAGGVNGPLAPQAGAPGSTTEAEGKAAYELNLLKRNLAYQVLPTLLSLKRVMEDARSIFLGDILQCLRALLYDYRDELSDILFHDPILAKQLDFDFKRNALKSHDFLHPPPQAICGVDEDDDDREASDGYRSSVLVEQASTGGRRSLLLDTGGVPSTAASSYLRQGAATVRSSHFDETVQRFSSARPDQSGPLRKMRRGSVGCLPACTDAPSACGSIRKAVNMSLPRLRKEAVALLTHSASLDADRQHAVLSSGSAGTSAGATAQGSSGAPEALERRQETASAFLAHLGLTPVKEPCLETGCPPPLFGPGASREQRLLPRGQLPRRTAAERGEWQANRTDDQGDTPPHAGRPPACSSRGENKENVLPPEGAHAVEASSFLSQKDLLEQELVLSALRSARRRHSLPSAGYYNATVSGVLPSGSSSEADQVLTAVGRDCAVLFDHQESTSSEEGSVSDASETAAALSGPHFDAPPRAGRTTGAPLRAPQEASPLPGRVRAKTSSSAKGTRKTATTPAQRTGLQKRSGRGTATPFQHPTLEAFDEPAALEPGSPERPPKRRTRASRMAEAARKPAAASDKSVDHAVPRNARLRSATVSSRVVTRA